MAAGDMLAYVHLADSGRHEPGTGHLDFDSVFRGLSWPWATPGWASMECQLSGTRRGGPAAGPGVRPRAARGSGSLTPMACARHPGRSRRRGAARRPHRRIVESGEVECAVLPVSDLPDGWVRVRTVRSAVSPGTEMTFLGRDATNVYLHRQWDRRAAAVRAGHADDGLPGRRSATALRARWSRAAIADVPVGHARLRQLASHGVRVAARCAGARASCCRTP